jgi:hypothetical protein
MFRPHKALPALALLSLAGCGGNATGDDALGPADERFNATLAGSSVVPATTSTSSGTITLEARDSTLSFTLSVANMGGITQAHLHNAAAGANGATLVWLLPVNGNAAQAPSVVLDGVISLGDISPAWVRGTPRLAMDSVKALMRAGRVYVDVHSSTFTNGELRGQIARAP